MLKDITLGQYFPGNTLAHRLDPRTKILLVMLYIVALFCAKHIVSYGLMALTLYVCVKISKVPFKTMVKGLRPVVFIVVFTAVLNLFFTPGERNLVEVGFLRISDAGLENAVFMVMRILLLIMGTFLMTYTTSPIRLTDGLLCIRSGGWMPKFRPSVREISTWAAFRAGPSTATLRNSPFGPTTVTRSFARNCPGWDKGLSGVRLWPKSCLACSAVTWTCRPDASTGTNTRSSTASVSFSISNGFT